MTATIPRKRPDYTGNGIVSVGGNRPTAAPRNIVLAGNCIKVMARLPAQCIDFVLTDPPYLCGYRDRNGRTILNDNDNRWVGAAFTEVYRVLKQNSVCVSFYGWNQADVFLKAWRKAGFQPAGHIVFAKTYGSRSRYVSYRHECAYVLIKGNPPMPANPLPDVLPIRSQTYCRGATPTIVFIPRKSLWTPWLG